MEVVNTHENTMNGMHGSHPSSFGRQPETYRQSPFEGHRGIRNELIDRCLICKCSFDIA